MTIVSPRPAVPATAASPVPGHLTRMTIQTPGHIGYYTEAIPELGPGQFLVRTLYSGVSAGTDLSQFGGTNFKVTETWDPVLRLFRPSQTGEVSETYPLAFFGYMQAGVVEASHSDRVKVGQIISMDYGHRTWAVVNDTDRFVIMPSGLNPILGIYPGKLGPVCANAILYAADELHRRRVRHLRGSLRGQRVAVFGAGVVGILTAAMAQWAGAAGVVIVDRIPQRLKVARQFGLTPVHAGEVDAAMAIKRLWPDPHDRAQVCDAVDVLDATDADAIRQRYADTTINLTGADIGIHCTGSDYVLGLALDAARVCGTVIDLGFYQGGAPNLRLGTSFHHNRVRLIGTQIGGPPEHQPQWTRVKLSAETLKFLREYGPLITEHLITHQVPFGQAQWAYDQLQAGNPDMLQVVLQP